MMSRRNGGSRMTTLVLRLLGHKEEPDPDFDAAADQALARSKDQIRRLHILEEKIRAHPRPHR